MIDPPDSGPSTPSCSTKLGALVDPLATPTKAWSPEISAPHSLTYDTSGAHITVINSGIVSLRTRAFYESVGFMPLEERNDIWGAGNPCLISVKPLS